MTMYTFDVVVGPPKSCLTMGLVQTYFILKQLKRLIKTMCIKG